MYDDSPMASAALDEYRHRMDELDPEIAEHAGTNANGARARAEHRLCGFCTAKLTVIA